MEYAKFNTQGNRYAEFRRAAVPLRSLANAALRESEAGKAFGNVRPIIERQKINE